MHQNPVFRQETEASALDVAAARGFGILILGDAVAHIPFLLAERRIEAHVMRSNPVARALREGPKSALLIVSGPDGYVSPDWYGDPDLVPTWNYVAVHLRGRLQLSDVDLREHLDRLSTRFEATLAPKKIWKTEKMSPEPLMRMMRTILPIEMAVEEVHSTFKLNQNRTASQRAGAAEHISGGGTPGMETGALAALMRGVPED